LRAHLRGAGQAADSQANVVAATAVRCRESLRQATEALVRARQLVESASSEELVAAELRETLNHLGQVAGVVYSDDILDRIFSRFCIGK
jgi:tRNA modification GTPase